MHIHLRFFAHLREMLGTSEEILFVPESVFNVGDIRQLLIARGGVWADALSEQHTLHTAYNHTHCDAQTLVSDQCEVAFFPPVTGG